jgi:hypothetical protein
MTNRIRRAVARPCAAAILLLGALAALPGNAAEIPAVPAPAASGTAAATQDALPELPHVLHPDAPLYPDYYAAALARTSLTDDPAYRPLRLQPGAVQREPTLIVLPVQTQAFGFSPTFRALLGARLDQELQRRHIAATRQTDIVDWRGPFVRRLDDATVAAFAEGHVGATLLTLYLGHDAAGHAFITLGKQKDGKTTLAHRRVDIPQDEIPTLDLFTQTLLPMLAELGLGDAKPAPRIAPHDAGGCSVDAWQLADISSDAPPDITACHALLMGTLMPDFLSVVAFRTQPSMPDRAAWLARAWVEADTLSIKLPAMRDAVTLAALQLRLDPQLNDAATLADSKDPVVRPLARMLIARSKAEKAPSRSVRDAADQYVEQASQGLPPFAHAIVAEHARFTDGFYQVDSCPMTLALPHFKVPADCEDEAHESPHTQHAATIGETALLDEWRLAAAWKELFYEGEIQGSSTGLSRSVSEMPARLARHPVIRVMRYAMREHDKPAVGIDAVVAQARSRNADYAQAIATLQRDDVMIRNNAVGDGLVPAVRTDAAVARIEDDSSRLDGVELLDFWSAILTRPELKPGPTAFLVDGNFMQANIRLMRRGSRYANPGASMLAHLQASAPRRSEVLTGFSSVWYFPASENSLPSRAQLEQQLAQDPSNMGLRTQLALVALEHGASIGDARKIIDARVRKGRAEDAIAESNDWALAAHMFFFSGALEPARDYYEKAELAGSGNGEQLHATERLRQIAGDVRGTLAAAQRRVERYGGEWAMSDEAALLFMLRRRDEGWAVVLPHLQTTEQLPLWQAAFVGLRMDAMPLAKLSDWMATNHVQVNLDGQAGNATWLRTYAIEDRRPTPADADVLMPIHRTEPRMPGGGAPLMKAALDGIDPTQIDAIVTDAGGMVGSDRWNLMPFYAWVAWNATSGKDPALDAYRAAPIGSRFTAVLTRAMLLAADGQRDQALEALTAARFELGRIGGAAPFSDDFEASPYHFVLATWLMSRKTGERAYADQGLRIARAYQHVWAWKAWPYAAEALFGDDVAARQIAACRAQFLDAGSLFLHESRLHPDPNGAVCRKATAW